MTLKARYRCWNEKTKQKNKHVIEEFCLEQLSRVDLQARLHTSLKDLVHFSTNAAKNCLFLRLRQKMWQMTTAFQETCEIISFESYATSERETFLTSGTILYIGLRCLECNSV